MNEFITPEANNRSDFKPTPQQEARELLGNDRGAYSRMIQNVRPAEQVSAEWDGVAETFVFDYRRKKDTPNALIEEPIFSAVVNGSIDGAHVLDVGTGSGWLINKMFAYGEPEAVVGLDISYRMLEFARKFAEGKDYKDRVRWLNRPIENSTLSDDFFDVITAYYSLDNVGDLRAALSEVNRTLKSGGWLFALIKHPERNKMYALAGTGEYHPGYNSWYYERWPGTGEKGVWARYMEWNDWLTEFNHAGFQTFMEPVDLEKNQALDSSLRRSYPQIREMYLRRPSGLIVAAQSIK